jgi:hypothetical protein
MNWKIPGLWAVAIGVVVYLIDANDEAARTTEASRQAVEALAVARISTSEPLHNLAGCMANHASEVSKLILATAVYKTSFGIYMPPEEIERFNEIRDVLYEKCSGVYYQQIVDKQGGFTYPNLNHAFIEVLKDDPGVKSLVQIHVETQKTRAATYVK